MEIVIRESKHNLPLKWFRRMNRYDSMTDVRFIDKNTFICGNREAGKLYLVKYTLNPNTVQILHSLDVIFNKKLKYVDLMTIKNNKLYFVSLDNTIGIVQIENNKLIKEELITIDDQTLSCHSITFDPTNEDIVYLGGALFDPKLVIFNIKTRTIIKKVILPGLEKILIKQIQFLDENRIIVSATSGLISETNKDQSYHSFIGLYDRNDFSCIDLVRLDNAHTDDVNIYENVVYLVCQGDSPENILKFKVENNKLIRDGSYSLPQFPHGIDIKYGMFASTSLKNSSVSIFEM